MWFHFLVLDFRKSDQESKKDELKLPLVHQVLGVKKIFIKSKLLKFIW